MQQSPVSKQVWLFSRNAIQPMPCPPSMMPQAFVFSRRPHNKAMI